MRMRWGHEQGQASPEYVAIVLVVAVVLGSAAALTSGGLGDATLNGMRRGLCALTGRAVRAAARPSRPAAVHAAQPGGGEHDAGGRDRRRLVARSPPARRAVLRRPRRGDLRRRPIGRPQRAGRGSGAVRVAPGNAAGRPRRPLLLRRGQHVALPRRPRRAAAFVRRWRHRQGALGGLLHDLHETCLLCKLVGHGPARMPAPDVTWADHGDALEASAGARLHFGADVAATMAAQTMGVRLERGGGRTRYLALSDRPGRGGAPRAAPRLGARRGAARGRARTARPGRAARRPPGGPATLARRSWRRSGASGSARPTTSRRCGPSSAAWCRPRSAYGTARSVAPFVERARAAGR